MRHDLVERYIESAEQGPYREGQLHGTSGMKRVLKFWNRHISELIREAKFAKTLIKRQAQHQDDLGGVPRSNPPKAPGNLLLIRGPAPKQQYDLLSLVDPENFIFVYKHPTMRRKSLLIGISALTPAPSLSFS